ncbi:uncharacterized protein LY89DRAFT_676821 [Mollisia scopiformis]|uniref:Rhodopsin domain-containing protein n=1 Tax=Mollisia scopiformis TaxID=149040 RepID=A0A132B7R0_MOLSC|nr:uncharacterized protein LY89DRAFT_676821 [Mollisia scopiformis]KUJ08401.1 hypothetical protein LY89DRAFT_676821 [Mollisia scopiformis]
MTFEEYSKLATRDFEVLVADSDCRHEILCPRCYTGRAEDREALPRRFSGTSSFQICVYILLISANLGALALWFKTTPQMGDCVRPVLAYSPAKADDAIHYEKRRLVTEIDANVFSGPPRPAHDEAWAHLIEPIAIKISKQQLDLIGEDSIEFADKSGYLAETSLYHELHCIGRSALCTLSDQEYSDHCLEYWREAAMCRGDTYLTPFFWRDGQPVSRVWSDRDHDKELSFPQIEAFFKAKKNKIFLANEFTYAITSPVVKISLIVFYRRIFIFNPFRRASDILITMCVLWGLATILGSATQCRPLSKSWNPTIEGKCFNVRQIRLRHTRSKYLPCYLYSLSTDENGMESQTTLARAAGSDGYILAGSIYRIYTITLMDDNDIPFWTLVEPSIGLVCGCLPTIRGLFPAYRVSRSTKGTAASNNLPEPHRATNSYNDQLQYIKMVSITEILGNPSNDDDKAHGGEIRVNTVVSIV